MSKVRRAEKGKAAVKARGPVWRPSAKFDAETRAALAEYDRTGEHITHEDMVAWLKSWGTRHELPMPPLRDRHGVPIAPRRGARPQPASATLPAPSRSRGALSSAAKRKGRSKPKTIATTIKLPKDPKALARTDGKTPPVPKAIKARK